MNTYAGSLQRRGKRYYLVIHKQGHQRWLALKTDKLGLARCRAAQLAPFDAEEERAWLEQLVREGERARMRLSRLRARTELTWENLDDHAVMTVDVGASADNREGHARWLAQLARIVGNKSSGGSPGMLTAEDAAEAVRELRSRYISSPRMISYYRRVWQAVGLNPDVWKGAGGGNETSSRSEHYRRLELEEVRRVLERCRLRMPPLADMVLLGYATGLRLSDVAQLEVSEVCLPFLRVCPNKTRRHKPLPLKIPLVKPACEVVRRLLNKAEAKGERYLFAEELRHRPSRRIVRIFHEAGVLKVGSGRASFHSLRATFISLMDDAGISPHVTDSITGHGGGGMHARYTQPSDETLLASVTRAIPSVGVG